MAEYVPLNAWRTNRIQFLRASVLAPNPGRVIITGTPDDRRQANWDTLSVALWMLAGLAHGDGVQKLDQINVFGHYETAVGTSDAASSGYITPQLIVDRPCFVRRLRRGYVHLASDAMHLLAAGAWVGALPGLASLLRRASDVARPERFALAVSATQRFSTLDIISVSALVMTGPINAWYLVGSILALLGTEYGRLFLCKLLIFAMMVALAAINRLRLTPRLATATTIVTPSRNALARLRRNTLLELGGGVAVVGIVAALGLAMPAMHIPYREHPHSMTSEAMFVENDGIHCCR